MVAERRFDGAVRVDLKAKAESQMAEACWIEVTASRNFQMRQQFLEDELKFNAQDLEVTEHSLDEEQGQLTTDTADLKMMEDALAEDTAALEDTTRVCQAKAVEFEIATNGRFEELDAYAKARAVISQKTDGAELFNYGFTQTSFLQLSRSMLSSRGGRTKFETVWKTKELAKSEHSFELVQLVSRVASAMHTETGEVNTHVQHVVHTVEVERPRIIKQTVQKPIIQEKINRVTKHVEVQLSQFTDKVVDIPVVVQRQVPIVIRTVQKTTDIPQLPCIDKVMNVPVGLVEQVPLVRVVAETAEISQLACETCVKDNMFLMAGEINVARKIRGQVDVECVRQHTGAAALQRQPHSIKQQPNEQTAQEREGEKKMRGQVEKEKGQGERERGERGKKEEETGEKGKEGQEETDNEVEKDVTGWTEVTRNKRKKMVQIFVKMDGGKTSAMEMEMNEKVDDILKKIQIQKDEDVYVTMQGKVLRRNEKLKSCGVTDGCTIQVASRRRGGGKHKDKKRKAEKQAASAKTPEQKCDGESRSDGDPEMIPMDEARRWLEENEEYLKILECTSEEK